LYHNWQDLEAADKDRPGNRFLAIKREFRRLNQAWNQITLLVRSGRSGEAAEVPSYGKSIFLASHISAQEAELAHIKYEAESRLFNINHLIRLII